MDVAARIAGKFGLKADITNLIAALHDIGHLPYGHYAEKLISEDLFPKCGLRVKHNENGPWIYSKLVTPRNVDPAVVCGIREHREIIGFHSSLESWAVAHADELASVISNIQDGLTLPDKNGHSLDEATLHAELAGTLLAGTLPHDWALILVSELLLQERSRSIARSPAMENAVFKLHSMAAGLHEHPWIRAGRLPNGLTRCSIVK
jgi:dGTP triphosphohydrolase